MSALFGLRPRGPHESRCRACAVGIHSMVEQKSDSMSVNRYRVNATTERPSALLYFIAKVYAIAANTFVESIRQPVYGVVLGLAVVLIAISPYITMFALQQSPRLIIDMGLATTMLAGLLLAAFTASSVISEELDNRTVLTVIAKPVGRGEFILGKFLGVIAGLTVATYLMSLTLVLTSSSGAMEAEYGQDICLPVALSLFGAMFIAVAYGIYSNFFNDKQFTSRAIGMMIPLFTLLFLIFSFVNPREFKFGAFGAGINVPLIGGCLMTLWAILLLAGVAVAASTRLTVVVNVTLCSGVFLLGLLSDYLFRDRDMALARILYRIVPNLQVFWVSDSLTMGRKVPPILVAGSGLYCAFILAGLLFLAMLLFQDREVA